MTYLTRLILNPRNRQAQREITDPYNLHRTILRAFGSERKKAEALHRLEINSRNGQITLLVQSAIAPDWNHLTTTGYLLPPGAVNVSDNPAVKEVNLSLQEGQTLRFRLLANPTIKKVRRDENGKHLNSNRVPLMREEKQLEWLHKRASDNGFKILQVNINQGQKQTSRKKKITLYTVQFDGHLQIINTNKFKIAVQQGIGPSKAFGCGLLSLGPP